MDVCINLLKFRRQAPCFSVIKKTIEGTTAKQFTIDTFAQLLYLCPNFYLHKWEVKNGGKTHELTIDIPKNIKQIVESEGCEEPPVSEPYENQMLSIVLEKRK